MTADSDAGTRAQEALHVSADFLKVLFDQAADAYFLIDLEGRIVDGNAAEGGARFCFTLPIEIDSP